MAFQTKLMILSALLSFIVVCVLCIIGIIICRGIGFMVHMWLHLNSLEHAHNWFIRRQDHDEEDRK